MKLFYYLFLFLCLLSCAAEKAPVTKVFSLKEMGELATVEYVFTKVVSANDEATWYKYGDRKIIFSVTAYAKAGIDLQNISEDKIVIDGDAVIITLPHAKLLSLNIPPDEMKQEASVTDGFRSEFTNEEKSQLLKQGEKSINATVTKSGLLKQAEDNSVLFLTNYLKQIGFKKVTLNFETTLL
jgi:Protein of unknown function (DUF4230)